jgi:hypothetical protein
MPTQPKTREAYESLEIRLSYTCREAGAGYLSLALGGLHPTLAAYSAVPEKSQAL